MPDLSRYSARKLRRLRRIATGIHLYRKTSNSGFLTIARIPDKLMHDPVWRGIHVFDPIIRRAMRTAPKVGAL